jgi:hypothetical protein
MDQEEPLKVSVKVALKTLLLDDISPFTNPTVTQKLGLVHETLTR